MSKTGKLLQMDKDLFEVKDFWKGVTDSYRNFYLDNEKVVSILADKEIIGAVKKYDGEAAKEVAVGLADAAYYLKDRNAVVEISRTVRKYDGEAAKMVAGGLAGAVYNLKDRNAVVEISRTVRKYDGEAAKMVALELANAAYNLNDKDAVVEMARTVSRYDGGAAKMVAMGLADVAYDLKDRNAVVEISRTVRKYDGEAAKEVAERLASAAYNLRDKDAVVEMARTVSRYDGEAAKMVAGRLADVAYDLNDKNKVLIAIKMLNKVGKSMFDVVSNSEIVEIINDGLGGLIANRDSFDAVAAYVKSGRKLPRPNESNIVNYKHVANAYLKEKYGIKKDMNIDQILMLTAVDKNRINNVVRMFNRAKDGNVKLYSLSASSNDVFNCSREELMDYAILSVVGSRNKSKESEAVAAISAIVGEKAVNKARSEFNAKHKHMIKTVAAALNESDYNKALDILKQTKSEAIMDVINAVDYRNIDISSAKIVKAVESKNPLDYDSRVQIACVYLPSGAVDENILEYCRDDNFVLVRYDVGNQTLGSAICYMEDGKFLVDSVEGHRKFRNPNIFGIVYNDLIQRAKEIGASMVIFNKSASNETPKEFLDYLEGKNLKKQIVKMQLDTDGYLEASENGVNGYVINL